MRTGLGRGMALGYFSSLAEGRTLREDIRTYYFNLLESINAKWWERAETLTETARRDAMIELVIGRDGTLVDMAASSTGSRGVDLAIAEVVKQAAPFPPLPETYGMELFRAPLKISAPSNFLRIMNLR